MQHKEDTYLSDWLENKMSDAQLRQLVTEEDFLAYKKLKNTLDNFSVESPDLDFNYSKIQEKAHKKNTLEKPKVIGLWKYFAVAACLLLSFCYYQVYYFSNQVETGFGLTKRITLQDNSKVTLNAKSQLSYANQFRWNRTLKLNGEAFFEVEKGSTFTVETPLGNVEVLGTKFNVIAFQDFFEVKCYEGKVKVTKKGTSTIVTKGENIRFYDKTKVNWTEKTTTKPDWIIGESSYKNVPVRYLIEQLKNQYNIEVSYPKDIENIKFTGTFTHKDLDIALQTICLPLKLKYTKDLSGKIIISE